MGPQGPAIKRGLRAKTRRTRAPSHTSREKLVPEQSFSRRAGLRKEQVLVFDEAPEHLRYGLREVLHELGYESPGGQRTILCKALRVAPDPSNWSDYPNIESEVVGLVMKEPWYEFFDALERLPKFLEWNEKGDYHDSMNALFSETGVGYRFQSGKIIREGTEEFDSAIVEARGALQDARFAEARRQFERGLEFRSARPPDWANAIKEAVNSVEGILQVIYGRPGIALTTVVKEELPSSLPSNIAALFKSLYGQGSGTEGARHAAIGGNEPTAARAELALHLAAALHSFAVAELDA